MPLTDIAIRTAKPTEKLQKLFDDNGLYPCHQHHWKQKLAHEIDFREGKVIAHWPLQAVVDQS